MNLYVIQNSQKFDELFAQYQFQAITPEKIHKVKKIHLVIIVGYEDTLKPLVNKIRNHSLSAFIAHISLNNTAIDCSLGLDCFSHSLDIAQLNLQLKTWIEAAKFRNILNQNENTQRNIFGAVIFSRKVKFYFNQPNSLDLIIEYFKNDKRFDTLNYSDIYSTVCFQVASEIVKLSKTDKPTACLSENNEYFFFIFKKINSSDKIFYEMLSDFIPKECLGTIGAIASKRNRAFAIYVKKHQIRKQASNIIPINQTQELNLSIDDNTHTALRHSVALNIDSAEDYINYINLDPDEIKELIELEEMTNSDLNNATDTIEILKVLLVFFSGYLNFINKLEEFENLAVGVRLVLELVSNLDIKTDLEIVFSFAILLKDDLCLWRTHIFTLQDTNNIHYLDSSIVASCLQIKGLLEGVAIEATEIEFF